VTGSPIANLEELLRALAKERSLRGRLRVLGHSWTLLRSLSPGQREQVALRLGSKWAWKRVEKAFLKDGELSENEQLVGRAFEGLAESDPGELRKLARMIREGDGAGAQDLLLMTLTEALEEEAEEDEALAPQLIELEGESEVAGESESEPEALLVSERIDRAEDVLASSLARPVEESKSESESESEPESESESEPSPKPDPKPALQPLPKPPPKLVLKPEPVAPRAFPTPTAAPQAPETEPAARASTPAPSPSAPELPIALAAGDSGADRFRVLRALQRSTQPGADLGPEGRAALLESLGGGWASRRALSRMIRTRSLDGLDEALHLIAELLRPGQQAWCLADLLAHWELGPDQLDRILEAAPSDAARRRLTHRRAAAALPR
jgi:hypothetical protein